MICLMEEETEMENNSQRAEEPGRWTENIGEDLGERK